MLFTNIRFTRLILLYSIRSMVICQVCNRNVESKDFCKYHLLADQVLKQNYDIWCSAYGKLTWNQYLKMLSKANETGLWVKEVIKFELKQK